MTWRFRVLLPAMLVLAGCLTDAATRLAADLEAGAKRIGKENGARTLVEHRTPSKEGECSGSYTVQLDEVGAMIVWCNDTSGTNVV